VELMAIVSLLAILFILCEHEPECATWTRPHFRLSTGRPVSQNAGNEGCAVLAQAEATNSRTTAAVSSVDPLSTIINFQGRSKVIDLADWRQRRVDGSDLEWR
jgi:hypothetical protein